MSTTNSSAAAVFGNASQYQSIPDLPPPAYQLRKGVHSSCSCLVVAVVVVLGLAVGLIVGLLVGSTGQRKSSIATAETRESAVVQFPLNQTDIDFINAIKAGWTAQHFSTSSFDAVFGGALTKRTSEQQKALLARLPLKKPDYSGPLPTFFDARQVWPECPSIRMIFNQGNCAGCWAFAPVSTMMDRICISTNGDHSPMLSVQDVLSCCHQCGYGCDGGYALLSWYFWISQGIVSGSDVFANQSGCMPLAVHPCDIVANQGPYAPCSDYPRQSTPKCSWKCQPSFSDASYSSDKHFGRSVYRIAADEASIRKEIMQNGPVQAQIAVYPDLLYYRNGVYKHVLGKPLLEHFVKIVGWGIDDDKPYWLLANSFGSAWGDNGYLKILRGRNECDIEAFVVAGQPADIAFESHNLSAIDAHKQFPENPEADSFWKSTKNL